MANNFLTNGLLGLGGIGGGSMPASGLLGDFYDPNEMRKYQMKQMLLGLGAGLMAEKGIGKGAALALAAGDRAGQTYRDNAMDAYKINRQQEEDAYTKQQREEEARQKREQNAWLMSIPDGQERMYAQFDPKGYLGNKFAPPDNGGGGQLGMTPVYMTNGKDWTIGQLSPNGGIYIGSQPAGPEWRVDPGGLKYAQTYGAKEGAGAGDAGVNYDSLNAKLPGLEEVVGQLKDLSTKATYTYGGQLYNFGRTQMGLSPSDGQVSRTKYEAIVANQILPMLRDTFGAQFTAAEGDNLRATLGDPNKTPEEKQAVLEAWIEQHKRNIQASGVQSGKLPPPGPGGSGPRLKFNPNTGELE